MFSAKKLRERLTTEGIGYFPMGDALGGRPSDPAHFRDGVADYEAMAERAEFRAGIARVAEEARRSRLCLLCAEREPLDCHRCLLVTPPLTAQGLKVGHILADGSIEPHTTTEERLLGLGNDGDLFEQNKSERAARLATAYCDRARAVAFRARS